MPKGDTHSQLTPGDISKIAVGVGDLPYRVRPTWNHVTAIAFSVTRRSYSRQTMSSHPAILKSYEAKVLEYQRFRQDGTAPKLVVHDEEPWERTIANLKADRAELQAKVVEYDQRMALHIGNAVRLGIPIRELERPVEKPYKGATDSTTGKRRPIRAVK